MPRPPATACWRNSAPTCRNMRRWGSRSRRHLVLQLGRRPALDGRCRRERRPAGSRCRARHACRHAGPQPGGWADDLPITLAFADGSGQFAGRVGVGLDLARLQAHYSTGRYRPRPRSRSWTATERCSSRCRTGAGRPEDPREQPLDRRCRSARNIDRAGLDGVDRVVGYVPPVAMAEGGLAVWSVCPRRRPSRAWPTHSGAACCW